MKELQEKIEKACMYLYDNYPVTGNVNIELCWGYDCIEAPDGNKGFGVFVPDTNTIYVATDVPEPEHTIIETIAHEYMHFIQKCAGIPYDEEKAERFGKKIVSELNGGTENDARADKRSG